MICPKHNTPLRKRRYQNRWFCRACINEREALRKPGPHPLAEAFKALATMPRPQL